MQWINDKSEPLRDAMVEAGIPDFGVGVTVNGNGNVNVSGSYRGQEVFNTKNIDRSRANQKVNQAINDMWQAYDKDWFTQHSNLNDPYRYAKQTYYGGMSLGLTLYLTDGPGIGPGDAAGAIYQTSTIVTAGLIFAGTYAYMQINDHMSKGGRANIWPDSYPKPNPSNINWSFSDSQLASGVTGGGVPTGPGSDWNKIKKWFRDTRRKIKGNFK